MATIFTTKEIIFYGKCNSRKLTSIENWEDQPQSGKISS